MAKQRLQEPIAENNHGSAKKLNKVRRSQRIKKASQVREEIEERQSKDPEDSKEREASKVPYRPPLQEDDPRKGQQRSQNQAPSLRDLIGKHPPPLHDAVSEWLASTASNWEEHSPSDIFVNCSVEEDAEPRPDMASTCPSALGSHASGLSGLSGQIDNLSGSAASSPPGSVSQPNYRRYNLRRNDIFLRNGFDPLPDGGVAHHVKTVLQADRKSPGPSTDKLNTYVYQLEILSMGCVEKELENFFIATVFPGGLEPAYGIAAGLETTLSVSMARHLVPNNTTAPYRVSHPKPDMLFGYSATGGIDSTEHCPGPFTESQIMAQDMIHPSIVNYADATTQGILFPFLAVEYKAAAGTGGNLWTAANQVAAGAAACLNIVQQLNTTLETFNKNTENGEPHPDWVENLVHTMAIDNNLAHIGEERSTVACGTFSTGPKVPGA